MKRFLVIGLGTFGYTTALGLMERGMEVLAADQKEERIEILKNRVTSAVGIDTTSEEALETLGIEDFDCAVVCIGDLESSVLTSLLLKKHNIPRLVARAANANHAQILNHIGVDDVLEPERAEAERLVTQLTASHILSYVTLAEGHLLTEISAPAHIDGHSVSELNLRARFSVNIIAIKQLVPDVNHKGEEYFRQKIIDVPGPEDIINEGDIIVVVGKTANIEKLKEAIEA